MYDPEISLTYDVSDDDGVSKHIEMKLTGDKAGSLFAVLDTVVEFLQAAGFTYLENVARNEAGNFVIYSRKFK